MNTNITYCRKCGSYLELRNFGLHHYDSATGEAIYKAKLVCPKKKFILDNHDYWDGTVSLENKFSLDVKYYSY